jgi:hypothetical protein
MPSAAPAVTEPTVASGTVVTAAPATELARIQQVSLGMDSGTGSVYRFSGIVSISGGIYTSVKVIMKYPDGTEYRFDAGSMGGANATAKNVIIYPDGRYQGQTAGYFISLDSNEYATTYQYTDGTIYRIATTADAATGLQS